MCIHTLSIPSKGDFFVDDRYYIEVWKDKSYNSNQRYQNNYIVADDIEIGFKQNTLWLFGFLY